MPNALCHLSVSSNRVICAQLLHTRELEAMSALSDAERSVAAVLMRRAAATSAAACAPPTEEALREAFDAAATHLGAADATAAARQLIAAQLRNCERFAEVSGLQEEAAQLRQEQERAEAEITVRSRVQSHRASEARS